MKGYYDLLFSDLEGTKLYEAFLVKHIKGKSVLEFACGTGDLLNLLDSKYEVMGVDIDESMLEKAVVKYPHLTGKLKEGNFLDYQENKIYDTVICVGDSLNYMNDIHELEMFVEGATKLSNTIIVDFHHPHRLKEFENEYYEEGQTDTFDYSYLIEVNEDFLIHTINFLNGTFDTVIQWVFNPNDLIECFKKKGYTAKIYTDFEHEGILNEGEKIMAVFTKEIV